MYQLGGCVGLSGIERNDPFLDKIRRKKIRLAKVRRLLAGMVSYSEILERMMTEENVTQRVVERWIAEVRRNWAAQWDSVDSSQRRAQAIAAAEDFYQICKSYGKDGLGPGIRTLQWLGELHGLTNEIRTDGRKITVVFNRPEIDDENDRGDSITVESDKHDSTD